MKLPDLLNQKQTKTVADKTKVSVKFSISTRHNRNFVNLTENKLEHLYLS